MCPKDVEFVAGPECFNARTFLVRLYSRPVDRAQMVSGVLIMTTYKLVVIPHHKTQSGMTVYDRFGHLPKEYLQVRKGFPQDCIFGHEMPVEKSGRLVLCCVQSPRA